MAIRVRAPMPGDEEPLPRAHGWWLAAGPLAAIAITVTAGMVIDATSPTGSAYRQFHASVHEVALCMSVLVIEAVVLIAILRARTTAPLTGRAFVLGTAMFTLLVLGAPFALHADAAISNLLLWHVAASAWLVLVGFVSGTIALVRRYG